MRVGQNQAIHSEHSTLSRTLSITQKSYDEVLSPSRPSQYQNPLCLCLLIVIIVHISSKKSKINYYLKKFETVLTIETG